MNKKEARETIKARLPKKQRVPSDFVNRVAPFLTGNVLSYFPLEDELDISTLNQYLWQQGRLYFPKIVEDELQVYKVVELEPLHKSVMGTYICQKAIPAGSMDIQTILVPSLGVDLFFHRLGRNRGYYDRFLKGVDVAIPRLSFVYKEQLCRTLPIDPWDEPLDKIFVF
jgi:5-formyltetrahydrofolate cyclo-ligase